MRHALLAVALVLLMRLSALAQPTLGGYEREALDQALAARGLELDPSPEGKVVGQIHVVNLEVFGPRAGLLQLLNIFHRTTRENIIRREVLLRPGDTWDPTIVEESRRRLSDPIFTALAVMTAVKSPEPGKVDLLVVTRDLWSLRLNSIFELQEGELTLLSVSLAENNFLGLRKQIAMTFDMDQGSYSVGPLYVDKNIRGTRMTLYAYAAALFAREDSEPEGSRSQIILSYPLWSLKRRWSATLDVRHFDGVIRSFLGTDLRTYDAPETAEDDAVPYIYARQTVSAAAQVTRAFAGANLSALHHQVTLGYQLSSDSSSLQGDFPAVADNVRAAFVRDVLPREEVASTPFVRWRVFTPRFVTYRNIDTYDLPEDRTLGPDIQVELGASPSFLGADPPFARASMNAQWTFDLAESGSFQIATSASTRYQDSELIDTRVTSTLALATPPIAGVARAVVGAVGDFRINETNNRFSALGGDTGLRGYRIGAFTGENLWRANIELRTLPIPVLFARAGALLFWDGGHAADDVSDLTIKHNLGLGLRWVVPQLQAVVFRFDYALPLSDDEIAGIGAGFPGRLTAGVDQAF